MDLNVLTDGPGGAGLSSTRPWESSCVHPGDRVVEKWSTANSLS